MLKGGTRKKRTGRVLKKRKRMGSGQWKETSTIRDVDGNTRERDVTKAKLAYVLVRYARNASGT